MHILDGHLPPLVDAVGFATATVGCALTLRSVQEASPPRVAMATSAFFVASSLHVPLYGTQVHLILAGLTGVVLGAAAFPAVLVGVVLQLLLLGFGGVMTLGVNVTTLGSGALVAAWVFRLARPAERPAAQEGLARLTAAGAAAGVVGTLASLAVYAAALLSAGEALRGVAWVCLVAHAPVVVVEGVMTALVVRFLARVQPELLGYGVALEPTPTSEAAP